MWSRREGCSPSSTPPAGSGSTSAGSPSGGGAFTASPLAADGRIYLASEDGDVFVIRAGPEYELLATNPMGEVCLATPAISEGQIIIRTTRQLVAAAEGAAPARTAARTAATPFPAALAAGETLALDDFEDGDLLSHTGVRWQTFTNGVSSARLQLAEGGAARVEGTLAAGAARGPLAQMYQPFDRGAAPVSLENLGGVRLRARGNRDFEMTIRCGGAAFGAELDVSGEWRQIELGVGELAPIAGDAAWSGAGCVGIYLSRRGEADLGEFWFEVDDITLFGSEAWESRTPR